MFTKKTLRREPQRLVRSQLGLRRRSDRSGRTVLPHPSYREMLGNDVYDGFFGEQSPYAQKKTVKKGVTALSLF